MTNLKSVLLLVPAELTDDEWRGVIAFKNWDDAGMLTREEMFALAEEWLEAYPSYMVMYDDDQLEAEDRRKKQIEEALVGSLFVPKGWINYGKKNTQSG